MKRTVRLSCVSVLLLRLCISASGQSASPREHFDQATVLYDWVTNGRGQKLRVFITQPKSIPQPESTQPKNLSQSGAETNRNSFGGKVPAIFFVGWLSCDSMEFPDAATKDGFGIFIRRLIDKSGYATVRMDKPGIGESQGNCSKADFEDEISGWKAAFELMSKYQFIDLDRVFVIGMSNGGGFSPLAVAEHPVRGYISCGSWGRTWYEHMLELERRRLIEAKKSPAEVNTAVKAFAEFYDLYLVKGMTPGQVIAEHPEWKDLWYDKPDGQYGRPAAFYQQLQALNLGETWQNVSVPVLVIRGSADTIMSRADSEAIAQIVNQSHPGHARYKEMDGMTHGFTVSGQFDDPVVVTVLDWIREQLARQQ
jgi:pimeloyl-ACP methyl ester carboxylesterase